MECLTPLQVKEILCVDKTYIYELFNSKGFPSFKVGSQWRITRDDLAEWIEKQKKKAM